MKSFENGDEVIAVDGPFKGVYGTVSGKFIDVYFVTAAEGQDVSGRMAISESFLEPLPAEAPYEEAADESDEVLEIPVPQFGMSQEAFNRHLEYMIGRSLQLVGDVGPEKAFFSFQEFEGKSASEVLLELMLKLEEGMAMFAQAHILIGRIVTALESVHDQN